MDNFEPQQKPKRLFIGVRPQISEKFSDTISLLKNTLGTSGIKWVPTENLHITIKFLGNTDIRDINKIPKAIQNSMANLKPFNLSFKSFGAYGNRSPKVLWAGIEQPQPLIEIFNNIESNFVSLGFKPEPRKFSPHLTIARIKKNISFNSLEDILFPFNESLLQNTVIDKVILFESRTGNSSPIYTPMQTFPF